MFRDFVTLEKADFGKFLLQSNLNKAMLILQEILQRHAVGYFSKMSRTQACQELGVKRFKSKFEDKENIGARCRDLRRLGHFITLGSAHFFYKTNLDQYLINTYYSLP